MKLPQRFGPMLFVLILSGLMSWLVAGVSTLRALGWTAGFVNAWTLAWLSAWCVAFPVALIAVPLARRVVERLTRAG